MNVLHVIDHFYPALGYQETFLAKVHSRRHNVLVITSNRFEKRIYESNKGILKASSLRPGLYVEEGLKVLRLPSFFDSPPFHKPWLIGLERAILNFKPDVIIVHGVVNFQSVRIARLKKLLHRVGVIVDDHMTYNATRGKLVAPLYNLFRMAFTPLLLKSVDRFVAVTCETRKFMQEIYGIPADRIVVIPLGVDRARFRYDSNARKSVRERYGIPENSVVFVYAGKVIPEKGVHLFVKAGIKLCKERKDVSLLIVGGKDEKYFNNLRGMIEKADLLDRMVFVDAVPNSELYEYYSAADVGVWPLQCSMTMLEAMSCGLPVIISDKSGALERIAEGNGIAYREGDVADLQRKMSILLNEGLRKEMGQKALLYAKKIDWTFIAQRFLDLLR